MLSHIFKIILGFIAGMFGSIRSGHSHLTFIEIDLIVGIDQAHVVKKTSQTAHEAGFKSALELCLGTKVNLYRIHDNARTKYKVSHENSFLLWKGLGTQKNDAYIFNDGRILLLSKSSLRSQKDHARLADDATLVTTLISKTDADVKPFTGRFYSPVYYAEDENKVTSKTASCLPLDKIRLPLIEE